MRIMRIGSRCGPRRSKTTAASSSARGARRRSMTMWSITTWGCRCTSRATLSTCLCQFLRRATWFTRLAMSTHRHTLSTTTSMSLLPPSPTPSNTTATRATPTGTSGGRCTRSRGAAIMSRRAAQEHGMAASTFTPMCTSRMGLATHMAGSTTVELATPTGCRDGQTPRRTGAVTRRTRAASSSTAPGRLTLGTVPSNSGAVTTTRRAALIPHCRR
mmetsp:Transcript_21018/g.49981  ORF Transcript_21018/g.49981 Transcript_21018/m.49981 type:complete len:216 (+) Transcript_21018:411-1058(+)